MIKSSYNKKLHLSIRERDDSMYVLPFLTVLALLMLTKKSSQKPYCILAGIFCILICSIYTGKSTPLQSISILLEISKNVLWDNVALFFTLILFGILIQLITDSNAILKLTSILNAFLQSKKHFCILLVLGALIASVDDYLACIVLITIFATCYKSFKLTKAELCFCINTIVVAFCSSLPISTWAPVIKDSITIATTPNTLHLLRYGYSFFIYFSVFAIFTIFFSKNMPTKKHYNIKTNKYHKINADLLLLLISVIILYLAYIIFSNYSIPFLSDTPLLGSCVLTLLFCQISFLKKGNIKHCELKHIYMKGASSMWNLVKFLYLLWIYTDCLDQILGINEIILIQISRFTIPPNLLPLVIFISSGIISYCTGSVFATVRLLVPISITLGTALNLNTTSLWLIASASLNGSLLASVSPLSDTIAICCEEIGLPTKKAYYSHVPYSFMTIIISAIAYLIAGYTLNFNLVLSIIAPLIILSPLLFFYIEFVSGLKSIPNFKDLIYQYHICLYNNFPKNEWRFAKQLKKQISALKNYTSKPIYTHPIYRLKLC